LQIAAPEPLQIFDGQAHHVGAAGSELSLKPQVTIEGYPGRRGHRII
jgi:hypothetical protein